ncbi:thiamine-phosphate kinase [Novilysobacter avium]|uniref:Thiamine-monophosphate kinase n=1 Tax=Novilysobacter avium TaxID=2781023 RepID=A0A7S6ZVR9_9GAMM|nr:thiamine-phosphate kinase [Lysobacter avium]QOW22469.1 thiamine-phosphate kinase [Lysobacter avium]
MAEFDLIERIRSRAPSRADIVLGVGDDAAVVRVPPDRELVICTDTLNAGVHFPLDTAPFDIGWKALAVNLSDLAAMGAQPAWCTLSLSMPGDDPAWLDSFLDGFLALAGQHGIALIGGDTTRGPLSIGVTAHGLVEPGRALQRGGAQMGDDIWVSGTLGDAAAALWLMGNAGVGATADGRRNPKPALAAPPTQRAHSGHGETLRERLDRPQPRLAVGLALVGIAHAAIDLSDGLWSDLGHVCRASGLGALVEVDALPASASLSQGFAADDRRTLQASGGDDYELCFTAPPSARAQVEALELESGTALTRIGRMVAGTQVAGVDAEDAPWVPERTGWVHFSD